MTLTFRFAQETDTPLILQFIRELADYEHLLDQVVADEATLRDQLFEKRRAEVLFALEDGAEVGFALFFHNFSTFLGRAGLYLEDLYVRPEHRGKGYGKALFRQLAAIAAERGCGRRPSPRSGAAAAWSGGAWTGTPPASAFTSLWGRRLWRTGPSTASPARHGRGWQNRNPRLRKPMRFDILDPHKKTHSGNCTMR